MQKILIADGTAGFRDQLSRILSSQYEIACAYDGMQAWNLIKNLQPDLLILDIEMPGLDGITLLQRMYAAGYHPAVMVVSRMFSDYAVDTLIQMGVGYLLRKPCDAYVAAARAEALMIHHLQNGHQLLENVKNILKELGIPLHLRGGKYLPHAIVLMKNNPSQYITKELYPAVGKRFGVDGSSVERCIRNAISKGWNGGIKVAWKQYFGEAPNGSNSKPSNTRFITQIVEFLENRPEK